MKEPLWDYEEVGRDSLSVGYHENTTQLIQAGPGQMFKFT